MNVKLDYADKRCLPLVKPDPDVENHCLDKRLLRTPGSRRFMQNFSVLFHWNRPLSTLREAFAAWKTMASSLPQVSMAFPTADRGRFDFSSAVLTALQSLHNACYGKGRQSPVTVERQHSPHRSGPVSVSKNESKHLQTNSLC